MSEYIYEWTWDERKGIPQQNQREEIVRCRDCKHCYETWSGYECERFSGEYHRAEPDGFCAWAVKRKEVGDD